MENSNKSKLGLFLMVFGIVLLLVLGIGFYANNKTLAQDQRHVEDFVTTLTENEPAFDRFCAYPLWEAEFQKEGGMKDIQRSSNRVEEKLEKISEPLDAIKGKKFQPMKEDFQKAIEHRIDALNYYEEYIGLHQRALNINEEEAKHRQFIEEAEGRYFDYKDALKLSNRAIEDGFSKYKSFSRDGILPSLSSDTLDMMETAFIFNDYPTDNLANPLCMTTRAYQDYAPTINELEDYFETGETPLPPVEEVAKAEEKTEEKVTEPETEVRYVTEVEVPKREVIEKKVYINTTSPTEMIGTYQTIRSKSINVRDNAGFSGKVIGDLKRGTVVYIYDMVYANGRYWCLTDDGWISEKGIYGTV